MTGIVILAAGASSRLGQPKQLLDWHGQPLIRHLAGVALNADLGPVTVVLGAVDQLCREALSGLDITVIHHADWASGMGGSIAAGVTTMMDRELDGVIVMLCDQPFVDAALLQNLKMKCESSGAEIVASRYQNQLGPPAIFSAKRFDQLLSLQGKGGAKSIINSESSATWIDAPQAATDIDTPDEWSRISSI